VDDLPGLDERLAAPAARRVLRPEVAAVLAEPVGAPLVAALGDLMGRELSAREWVEVAAAWKRLASFCAGAQLAAVAEVDRALSGDPDAPSHRPGRVAPTRAAADELAAALAIAPQAASRLVGLSRQVEAHLPAAGDAVVEGRMDRTQLAALATVTRDLRPGPRQQVEALAVRLAPRCTVRQLGRRMEELAARLDPEHAARRVVAGVEERDVVLRPSPLPGCKRVVADLPLVDATACVLALNGLATAAKARGVRGDGSAEDRSVGQLRADGLTALVTGTTGPGDAGLVPTRERLAQLAEVQVVVAADTLLGDCDLPATVPGVGPLDAESARALAVLTRWRRLSVDADGHLTDYGGRAVDPVVRAVDPVVRAVDPAARAVTGPRALPLAEDPRWVAVLTDPPTAAELDHGRSRYRPPPPLRAHVESRDAVCIGPACDHTARRGQLDHTVEFGRRDADGRVGVTSAANLGASCPRVHNAKTHGGWGLQQPSPGDFVWTSPTGRTYARRAHPLVPGWSERSRGPTTGDADARPP
jgi:hypothetical protein